MVAHEQKLLLILELKDSLRISDYYCLHSLLPRFSGFTQLILSPPHIILYISIKYSLSYHSFKVVKLNFLYLSSKSSLSNPNGILVALLWTLSILSMSPCKLGFQACTAYSKCGFTRETYRSFHSPGFILSNILFNIPSILFAFATILFTCPLHFRSSLTFTP